MLKVWGRNNSVNVKKVLWIAAELGLGTENIPAGGEYGVVNDAGYRALNPNGRVPTIEDGDVVLWESNTIVRYLAAKYGNGKFYIADTAGRAQAEKWMDWATASLAGPFRDILWHGVRLPPKERNAATLAAGVKGAGELFAIADGVLARQPYLSGAQFGVGDVPVGCFVYGWFQAPIERPTLPNLAAWYDGLTARPAYQKAVMIPLS
jgi:glutathione S-transferase